MRRSLERLWYGTAPGPGDRALGMALTPLSWAYRAGLALSASDAGAVRLSRPVISVGNLSVGGNGKTPLVIELARRFAAAGRRVAVISRGYGRRTRGVRAVHAPGGPAPSADEAGDEPALVSWRCAAAAVVVGEDRVAAGGEAIARYSPEVVVCDDAFQHRRLARDLDLVAVHAGRGFGNRRLLPRGPLREAVSALKRASLLVFTHARGEPAEALIRRHGVPDGLPALACDLVPEGLVSLAGGESLPVHPGPWVGACAIADPEGFARSCREAGAELAGWVAFPDHHFLDDADRARLSSRVLAHRARGLVVTEKDLVRLRGWTPGFPVLALRLQVRFSNPQESERLDALLAAVFEVPS